MIIQKQKNSGVNYSLLVGCDRLMRRLQFGVSPYLFTNSFPLSHQSKTSRETNQILFIGFSFFCSFLNSQHKKFDGLSSGFFTRKRNSLAGPLLQHSV
jgi:hypothetical protein